MFRIRSRNCTLALGLLSTLHCGRETSPPAAPAPNEQGQSASVARGPASDAGSASVLRRAGPAPVDPPAICAGTAAKPPVEHARQMLQAAHAGGATRIAMSRGPLVATMSQFDAMVRVWDVRRRVLVGAFHAEDFGATMAWNDASSELSLLYSGLGENMSERRDLQGRVLGTDSAKLLPPLVSAGRTTLGAVARDTTNARVTVKLPGAKSAVTLSLPPSTLFANDDAAVLSRDGKTLAMHAFSSILRWAVDKPSMPPRTVPLAADLKSMVLSPDLDFAVVATQRDPSLGGYRISIVPFADGAPPVVLTESQDSNDHVDLAISPDGSSIVAAVGTGVIAWNTKTRKRQWELRGHAWDTKGASSDEGFDTPAFTADGKLVVTQVGSGPMAVIDAVSGRLQGRMGEPVRVPNRLEWAGGDRLVAGSYGHLVIWDTLTGSVARSYDEPDLLTFALLPNGDLAGARSVTCDSPGVPHTNLWVDGWTGLEEPAAFSLGQAPDPHLGCDARYDATSRPDVRLAWPPARGIRTAPVVVPGWARKIDLDHHLAMVPSKVDFRSATDSILDLSSGTSVLLQGLPRSLQMTEDGVLAGGWFVADVRDKGRQVVSIWDAKKGNLVATLPESGNGIYAGLSMDGRYIGLQSQSHLSVYELPGGKKVRDIDFGDEAPVLVGFADGANDFYVATVANGAEGNGIHHVVGDVATLFARDPAGLPASLVPSPDRKRLASRGPDGAIRLWDTASRRLLATLAEFDDDEYIAYTPGGAYAGTAEVASRVGWVFESPVEPFRFEQFANVFDRPDLVERRLAGEDIDVAADLDRPPRVEIESTKPGPTRRSAKLRVHVSSASRVSEVRVYVEGRSVARQSVCAADAHLELDAPLMAERNHVEIVAYDDHGFASNPATADLEGGGVGARRPELWAVAIGVSSYPNLAAEYQLRYAEADATGVLDAFARQIGDGKTYAAIHPTSVLGQNVTPASVASALGGLGAMKEDDVAIVFFAGHGVKPTPDEDMVFLTAGAANTVESVRANGVGWRTIGDALAHTKGRVLVLLDACHAGHLTQDLVVPNSALADALASSGRAGTFVFAASKGRQTSFEPAGTRGVVLTKATEQLVTVKPAANGTGGHGFFTGALLASLDAPETDANGDKALELSEIVDAVTDRVVRASNGRQTPWVARREIRGDFTVAGAATSGGPP